MAQKKKKAPTASKSRSGDTSAYIRKSTAGIIAAACLVIGFYLNTVITGLMQPAPQQTFVAQAPTQAPQSAPTAQVDAGMSQRIADQEHALTHDPQDAAGWAKLGDMYFDSNQPAKAIEAYNKSLKFAPGNANILTDLGVMYRRSGQPRKALDAFSRAVAASPDHEIARFNSGIVLMHDLNDLKGALAAWQGLLGVNPDATAPNGTPVRQLVDELSSRVGSAPAQVAPPEGGPRLLPPVN